MEQWALGVNLIQDKLRQGPLGQAYKLCGKLFKKMTGGDSDSKETKGERKQQESKGQSQSNRGPGVLQTRTTTGGEGKDDGDGDGHEERRGKRNLPPDAISVVEQEQEENEDDDEEEVSGGKIANTPKQMIKFKFSQVKFLAAPVGGRSCPEHWTTVRGVLFS